MTDPAAGFRSVTPRGARSEDEVGAPVSKGACSLADAGGPPEGRAQEF